MDVLIIIVVLFVIIICAFWMVYAITYNKIQDSIIRINEAEVAIDSNLRNKYDLINRAISLIKGNIENIDSKIFEEIIKLRSRKISNFDLDRKLVEASNEVIKINGEHKDLEISDELKKNIKELKIIDEKLETLRDYYNNNILNYNKLVKEFPTNVVARLNKYEEKLFFDKKDMTDNDEKDFKL